MSTQHNFSGNRTPSIFLQRSRGRRVRPDNRQPPYLTEEGMVLIDRRSHAERRSPPAAQIAKRTTRQRPL